MTSTTKTTEQTKSMKEILQNLTDLQYVDSKIDELTRMRGDLPEEILDIDSRLENLQARINRNEAEKKELKMESDNLELEIKEAQSLVEKYEEQQLSVRNNREYDALTKEIESQKQTIENGNSRIEEIALQLEELDKSLEENRRQYEETEAELKEKKQQLEDLERRTQSEEKQLEEKREELAAELPERYRRSYERLRNGFNNGRAVVAMEKGSSLGMMLPPQVQVEVRRMNKIVIDENSGRIVVDPSFFDEAKKRLEGSLEEQPEGESEEQSGS